jgi:hypothetical protein
VADGISQLEGLFDLPEESFDGSAKAVKVGDTAWAPIQIASQEDHFLLAQHLGLARGRRDAGKLDELAA